MSRSLLAYLLCAAVILGSGLWYYPKWKLDRTEATLSWDVSGYYFYLPAIFIYHDIRELAWQADVLRRYDPAPPDQAYQHESGAKVMKYSAGLALQYLPFFLIAHAVTPLTDFPADGFSRPYQLAISFGSMLMALLGLWLLRLLLLKYFRDSIVAIVLLIITLATNYLDYAGINHAMTHNYLFTWYAALILLSIRYWQRPSIGSALAIGFVTGLMALTRPSEIVALLLPVLWGIGSFADVRARVRCFKEHATHLLVAGTAFVLMGLIQMCYWKYVTGDWIVYSYQEQSFSWFSPHIINGMFSYRSGWLVYTPVMVLALAGFWFLWKKQRAVFVPVAIVSAVFMYITWAWDIWWYGGSLGQRAMVQLYPVLALPLAACITWLWSKSRWRIATIAFLVICAYYNLWLTHQAHRGGLLRAGEMTKAYFWKILGRYEVEDTAQFLLDNRRWYRGKAAGTVLYKTGFEELSDSHDCALPAITGSSSLCIGGPHEFSPMFTFDIPRGTGWLRAEATFRGTQKEWDVWKMPQFRLHLRNHGQNLRTSIVRIHRVLHDGETRRFHVDLRVPDDWLLEQGAVDFWSAGSEKVLLADDLTVWAFQ